MIIKLKVPGKEEGGSQKEIMTCRIPDLIEMLKSIQGYAIYFFQATYAFVSFVNLMCTIFFPLAIFLRRVEDKEKG